MTRETMDCVIHKIVYLHKFSQPILCVRDGYDKEAFLEG